MKPLTIKKCLLLCLLLAACSDWRYRPLPGLATVNLQRGYRIHQAVQSNDSSLLILLQFSGGGTRAAALGYGVLEALQQQPLASGTLLDQVDLVFGVSGGSILAAYFSLHGPAAIPSFERHFLKQDFQKRLFSQLFSLANWPYLTAPDYGRGDLLQQELDRALFHHATFADLRRHRRGPFAVISATDMSQGTRLDFTQKFFDVLCLDLDALPLARAVAASSAVPILFSPITLNNRGGQCGYRLPAEMADALADDPQQLQSQTRREYAQRLLSYQNSAQRPYIHLLDGGLTDNLALRAMLDLTDLYSEQKLLHQFLNGNVRKIVVINVNAQNEITSTLDRSAAIPDLSAQVMAVIDIPIAQNTAESLRRFRAFVDGWNAQASRRVSMYFVSLNLRDLPPGELRERVLNLPTSFHLPPAAIDDLKRAARQLLARSSEYQRLLRDLRTTPVPLAEGGASH